MSKLKNLKEIDKAVLLYLSGFSQKEIAEKLSITEKTIGVWLQPIKAKLKRRDLIIEKLEDRLENLVKANSPAEDIKNIAYAIKVLENKKLNKIII